MIELNKIIIYTTGIILFSTLFFVPLISYSDNLDDWGVPEYQRMISSDSSFNSGFNIISANVQYQVRDISDGLVCIVQSDTITIYDSKFTFNYISNHPSHATFENNGGLINYVSLRDSWNVGEGDSFLSALRYIVTDPANEKPYDLFFATTNGCAVQPGDKVSVLWEIVYN